MPTYDNLTIANLQKAKVRIPESVKNLTVGFPDQPGKVFFKDANFNTTISGALVTAEGLRLRRSGTGSLTVTLSGVGDPNRLNECAVNWSFSYSNRKVFGTWHITLWQDSESDANIIPHGSNVNPDDYDIFVCSDYRSLPSSKSDLSKILLRVWIRNKSSEPKTIIQKCEVRYILEAGSL